MFKSSILFGAIFGLCVMQTALAEDSAFEASLYYRQGEIILGNGIATLSIPDNFRYLDAQDAERVLVDAWGNPEGANTWGMLFPSNVSPLSDDGWGVVITYEEDGHVSDDDADSINYSELLEQMQARVEENNKKRAEMGYETVALTGWAAEPYYDKTTHKMYWAKELKFGDSDENTLNYNIRVLGREGVLVLNAVSSMEQIGEVKNDMEKVIAFTNFSEGNRYQDFNPNTDQVATYGLAALVAGGVAAKMGLLGKLGLLLLAAKKFIVFILIGIGALVMRFFTWKKG